MHAKAQLDLTKPSLSSATWYLSVPIGWALIVYAAIQLLTTPQINSAPAFVTTATILVALELLPLVRGRGYDPQGITMSTAFVCAMMFVWGVWPAVLFISVASLTADLHARKTWWKIVFNPSQYAISVAVGYLVMVLTHNVASLQHPRDSFELRDLLWIAGVCVTYFVVNLTIVDGVLSYAAPFAETFVQDLRETVAISFAVMGLSPLVLLAAVYGWSLIPLLMIPLLLLRRTASISVAREREAGHDSLTGLPNRATLSYEVNGALSRFERDHEAFGLVLIDLDDFKRVNDTLGHQAGDQLLVEFARRLRERARPTDIVARLGGDEFAIVIADADRTEVLRVAANLRGSLEAPIQLGDISIEMEASFGVAACPDDGEDVTLLLRRADVAMYNAKDRRTGIESYIRDTDENSTDRLSLVAELRHALETDAIELFYQPKVGLAHHTPIGVEALVRWRHVHRGYIAPDEFIPLAERSGIMPRLTERVIDLALTQAAQWRAEGIVMPVAVNIAPSDLSNGELVDVVRDGLARHSLPPASLELEITERTLTRHDVEAQETLAALHELGIAVSLDDFGTGYSSLLRLSSLPVDEIKIDRGFIAQMSTGRRGLDIVRALVDLAHALDIPAIAEGVETIDELNALRSLGCDAVQGWLFGRPMAAPEATAWLHDNAPVLVSLTGKDDDRGTPDTPGPLTIVEPVDEPAAIVLRAG